MKSLFLSYAIPILLLIISTNTYSSHMRAAEITVRRISCDKYEVEITITAYVNSKSGVLLGGDDILFFGDGSSLKVPETLSVDRPDLGKDIGVVVFYSKAYL